ncbi:MAG: hypothetical protein H6Q30_2212, partial [Bacteroidetes bacterium]|nr:hypothetical protein [Bacteroidota bacterium]
MIRRAHVVFLTLVACLLPLSLQAQQSAVSVRAWVDST